MSIVLLTLLFTVTYAGQYNFCLYYHGTCEPHCLYQLTHKWNIPLCIGDVNICCAPEFMWPKQPTNDTRTTTAAVTKTTLAPTTPSQPTHANANTHSTMTTIRPSSASTHQRTTLPTTTTTSRPTTVTAIHVTTKNNPVPTTVLTTTRASTAPSAGPETDHQDEPEDPENELLNTMMAADPGAGAGVPSGSGSTMCGAISKKKKPHSRIRRIVGGINAKKGAWPWVVAIKAMSGMTACSGVLIAPSWVITAAHCFKRFTDPMFWRVRIGEYDLSRYDGTERDIVLRKIFWPRDYQIEFNSRSHSGSYNATKYRHDIALIQLDEELVLDGMDTNTICLPSLSPDYMYTEEMDDDFRIYNENADCWVTGWGLLKDNATTGILQQAQGNVISGPACEQMWNKNIDDNMVCFGDGNKGPCTGDSGGPLMCQKEGQYFLVGVVSWGTEGCSRTGYPSVFTRIWSYMEWIREVITITEEEDLEPLPEP